MRILTGLLILLLVACTTANNPSETNVLPLDSVAYVQTDLLIGPHGNDACFLAAVGQTAGAPPATRRVIYCGYGENARTVGHLTELAPAANPPWDDDARDAAACSTLPDTGSERAGAVGPQYLVCNSTGQPSAAIRYQAKWDAALESRGQEVEIHALLHRAIQCRNERNCTAQNRAADIKAQFEFRLTSSAPSDDLAPLVTDAIRANIIDLPDTSLQLFRVAEGFNQSPPNVSNISARPEDAQRQRNVRDVLQTSLPLQYSNQERFCEAAKGFRQMLHEVATRYEGKLQRGEVKSEDEVGAYLVVAGRLSHYLALYTLNRALISPAALRACGADPAADPVKDHTLEQVVKLLVSPGGDAVVLDSPDKHASTPPSNTAIAYQLRRNAESLLILSKRLYERGLMILRDGSGSLQQVVAIPGVGAGGKVLLEDLYRDGKLPEVGKHEESGKTCAGNPPNLPDADDPLTQLSAVGTDPTAKDVVLGLSEVYRTCAIVKLWTARTALSGEHAAAKVRKPSDGQPVRADETAAGTAGSSEANPGANKDLASGCKQAKEQAAAARRALAVARRLLFTMRMTHPALLTRQLRLEAVLARAPADADTDCTPIGGASAQKSRAAAALYENAAETAKAWIADTRLEAAAQFARAAQLVEANDARSMAEADRVCQAAEAQIEQARFFVSPESIDGCLRLWAKQGHYDKMFLLVQSALSAGAIDAVTQEIDRIAGAETVSLEARRLISQMGREKYKQKFTLTQGDGANQTQEMRQIREDLHRIYPAYSKAVAYHGRDDTLAPGTLPPYVMPADKIAAALGDDEAFAHFFLSDKGSWLFILRRNAPDGQSVRAVAIAMPGSGADTAMTRSDVGRFVTAIRDGSKLEDLGVAPHSADWHHAHCLYEATFGQKAVKDVALKNVRSLVISRDHELGILSFDMLVLKTPDGEQPVDCEKLLRANRRGEIDTSVLGPREEQAADDFSIFLDKNIWLVSRFAVRYVNAPAEYVLPRPVSPPTKLVRHWVGFGDTAPPSFAAFDRYLDQTGQRLADAERNPADLRPAADKKGSAPARFVPCVPKDWLRYYGSGEWNGDESGIVKLKGSRGLLDRSRDAYDPGHQSSDMKLGANFSKNSLLAMFPAAGSAIHYGVLEFATHGYYAGSANSDEECRDQPMLIGSAPFDDQPEAARAALLTDTFIANLGISADVVVLAVCDAAVGAADRVLAGDQLSGLVKAFLLSDVGAVVAPMWQVDVAVTDYILVRMMSRLAALGPATPHNVALALQGAKLDYLTDSFSSEQKLPGQLQISSRADRAPPRAWAAMAVIHGANAGSLSYQAQIGMSQVIQ